MDRNSSIPDTAWSLMRDRIQRNKAFFLSMVASFCFIELHCPLKGLRGTAAQALAHGGSKTHFSFLL